MVQNFEFFYLNYIDDFNTILNMKQKTFITTEYYADDGAKFNSADECKRYESETLIPRLYINNLIDYKDAEAIVHYIDMIMGQFDIIKEDNIRKVKMIKMLTSLKNKICDASEE